MEDEIREERLVKERKKKVLNFLSQNKSLIVIIVLLFLLGFAWYIRTVNVENLKDVTTGDYTLGPDLDPFLFLRYSKHIINNGRLMAHDSMRFVPLGYDTSRELIMHPYMIAYFHKALNLFSSVSVNYSATIYPAFMFVLTALAFFLFVNKIFEKNKHGKIVALISTAFLIMSPSLVSRTVAGIPEKESAGFFFLFLAFYFLICSWRENKLKKAIIFSCLAGISTAMMGLVWGGWIYILTTVSLFFSVVFILGKINKKTRIVYFSWFLISMFLPLLFSQRYSFRGLMASSTSGLCFAVFFLYLVDFIIFETPVKKIGFVDKIKKKMPDRIFSLIVFVVLAIVLSSVFLGISFLPTFIRDIFFHLKQPYSDRLAFTVAENRQPYFDTWKGSFGPNIKNLPLLFWLFFTGSIFLVYETLKKFKNKDRWIFTLTYIVFLFGLIFSRYSQNSVLNGENFISRFIYFGSIALVFIVGILSYYKHYKENSLNEFEKINFAYLFLILYFFISIIGARSAIRLIMGLAPSAAIMAGFLAVNIVGRAAKEKGETLKIVFSVLAIIIVLCSAYSFYYNYQVSKKSAESMIPSSYTHQWQRAMAWVRENTERSAVFAHWWDYGYWVQSIGNRATVLDGGNSISYWNHLMGRHVLIGHSEEEALEFLYAHNSTHLLIDSTDIGKYSAFSSIGGDVNYDRYSQMPTFYLDEQNIQETKNETVYFYSGGTFLDEDFMWKTEDKQIFFPRFKAGIGGVFVRTGKDGSFKQPTTAFVYQGKQVNIPLKCIYYEEEKYEFEKGYGGCLYIIPQVGQTNVQKKGSALFITEKSMKALWVKLYLFDEGENFELAHKEPNAIVQNIQNQGVDIGDIVRYGGIQGPIKIWKINYPENIEFKAEYLSRDYPEELRRAKEQYY